MSISEDLLRKEDVRSNLFGETWRTLIPEVFRDVPSYYDEGNAVASLGHCERWSDTFAAAIRRHLPRGSRVLDVCSGTHDIPLRLLAFFVLLLLVRGLPSLLVYRRALPLAQRLQMMFITATALPLLVALAEIGLRNGTMLPENAAALVGAGVLSVIVYPAVAVAIGARSAARTQAAPTPGEADDPTASDLNR